MPVGDYANNQLAKFVDDPNGDVAVRVHEAEEGTWLESASADNAVAAVTRPAAAGQKHFVSAIMASFSAIVAGATVTVKDGATPIATFHVHNQREINFAPALQVAADNILTVELAASGTLGTVGAVTVVGYTK